MASFGLDKMSGCLAVALYDNQSQHQHELSFKRGDLLTILACEPAGFEGWWICSKDGKRGIAPANCLTLQNPLLSPTEIIAGDSVYEQPDPLVALSFGPVMNVSDSHCSTFGALSPIREEKSPAASPFRQSVYENTMSPSLNKRESIKTDTMNKSNSSQEMNHMKITRDLQRPPLPQKQKNSKEVSASISKLFIPSKPPLALDDPIARLDLPNDYEIPYPLNLPESNDYFQPDCFLLPSSHECYATDSVASNTSDYGSSSQSSIAPSRPPTTICNSSIPINKTLSVYMPTTSCDTQSSPLSSLKSSISSTLNPRAVSSVMEYTTYPIDALEDNVKNLTLLNSNSLGACNHEPWHRLKTCQSPESRCCVPNSSNSTTENLSKSDGLTRLKALHENFLQLNEKIFKFVHSKWKLEESLQFSLPVLKPTCEKLVISVLDFMRFCRETLAFNSNFCADRVLPKKLWRHLRPLEEMSVQMATSIEKLHSVQWKPKEVAAMTQNVETDHLGKIIQCVRDCAIEIRSLTTTIQNNADLLFRSENNFTATSQTSPIISQSNSAQYSSTLKPMSSTLTSSPNATPEPSSSKPIFCSKQSIEQFSNEVQIQWSKLQPHLKELRQSILTQQLASTQLAHSKVVLKHATDLVYAAHKLCPHLAHHSRERVELERIGNSLLEALKQLICETKLSYQDAQNQSQSLTLLTTSLTSIGGVGGGGETIREPFASKLLNSVNSVQQQAQSLVTVINKL